MRAVVLTVTLLVVALGCAQVDVPTDASLEGIHVSGVGRVRADPDIARVQIGVETFDVEVASAISQNNGEASRIITAIKGAGVADADVGTAGFTVAAQRDFRLEGPDKVVGFQVTNTVAVTMRDISTVGDVLQAALDAGANNVHGFTLGVDDTDALRQEARAKAVEDARARAQVLADSAGVTLGAVTSLVEATVGSPTVTLSFRDAVAESSVPIAPDELELTVTVQVVFSID